MKAAPKTQTLASLASLASLTSCFPYSDLPNDRPDPVIRKLADAKILEMKVNLHKQPGLCPGKEGKLYVNAKVQWPGAQPVMRSLGSDVDSLDPATFVVGGALIKGDSRAHLFPSADVVASVETGFVTDVQYSLDRRFSFHETFPPEYSCFDGFYLEGQPGNMGGGGTGGMNGNAGEHGGHADPGGNGDNGANGGHIVAYVTEVSTPFYQRLFAVSANGTFFLAPPDRPLMFDAAGGAGGQGGQGGFGGQGGDQPTESREIEDKDGKHTIIVATGSPGNGGNGGNGGMGGDGGNGGVVEVIVDGAFPELRGFIQINVNGGEGGAAGDAGGGGAGGGTNADRGAQTGQPGGGGQQGRGGRGGGIGRARVSTGAVSSAFRGIRGIQILGSSAPAPTKRRR